MVFDSSKMDEKDETREINDTESQVNYGTLNENNYTYENYYVSHSEEQVKIYVFMAFMIISIFALGWYYL